METDDLEALLGDPQQRDALATTEWTRAQAEIIVQALLHSGLSVRQFAARHGLKDWRLYRWRRQLAPNAGPASRGPGRTAASTLPAAFVPVELPAALPASKAEPGPRVEIRHPSGLRIRFSHPPPQTTWQQILLLLVPPC
jgi:transposase-like protein